MKETLSSHPAYPWPHVGLAEVYSSGRFADAALKAKEVDAFFQACPNMLDFGARNFAASHATPEIAARYAKRLREKLADTTDQNELFIWPDVWSLEFKGAAPSEHDRIREHIRKDLARLEELPVASSPSWLALLAGGYAMLGDEASQDRLNDRLLREFPASVVAFHIQNDRWRKSHPEPSDDDPEEKKQAAYREELSRNELQLRTWPDNVRLLESRLEMAGRLQDISSQYISSAADALAIGIEKYPQEFSFEKLNMARAFERKNIRLEEVPALVSQSLGPRDEFWVGDGLTDEVREQVKTGLEERARSGDLKAAEILVEAARQLNRPEVAKAARELLGDRPPAEVDNRIAFWTVKAKLAEFGGSKLDALMFYREAIAARPADFKVVKHDELLESESRLWKEFNGSDESRYLFVQTRPPVGAGGSDWRKPVGDFPSRELTDIQGKKWKSTDLHGQTLLINVWATWCISCMEELPHLQKLYDKLKDRPDVQVLSLDIDGEPGLTLPYVKKNGYTFPVLFAQDFVRNLVPDSMIPRNWIVGPDGQWRWEEVGFVAPNWTEHVDEKLEAVQKGSSQ
jgi:thiol-disulfide isomerase/thioredoxin